VDKDLDSHLKAEFVRVDLLGFALLLDIQLGRSLQGRDEDMMLVEMLPCMGNRLDSLVADKVVDTSAASFVPSVPFAFDKRMDKKVVNRDLGTLLVVEILASLVGFVDTPLDSWKVDSFGDKMMDVAQTLEAFASFVVVVRMGMHTVKDTGKDMEAVS